MQQHSSGPPLPPPPPGNSNFIPQYYNIQPPQQQISFVPQQINFINGPNGSLPPPPQPQHHIIQNPMIGIPAYPPPRPMIPPPTMISTNVSMSFPTNHPRGIPPLNYVPNHTTLLPSQPPCMAIPPPISATFSPAGSQQNIYQAPPPRTAGLIPIATPIPTQPVSIFPTSGPMNVFVGKLPPDVHDAYVRSLLEKCGHVLSWKRTMDPETRKAKGFGYCTYNGARDVLRALRLLNDFIIDSKKILLKVDSKTKSHLEEYEKIVQENHPELLRLEAETDIIVKKELQQLYEDRSGLHGGKQNNISSWGSLVENNINKLMNDNDKKKKSDKKLDGNTNENNVEKHEEEEEIELLTGSGVEHVRGQMIMTEIEKFRLNQEKKQKERDVKRREILQERIRRETEEQKRREEQIKKKPEKKDTEPDEKSIESSVQENEGKDKEKEQENEKEKEKDKDKGKDKEKKKKIKKRKSRSRSTKRYYRRSRSRSRSRSRYNRRTNNRKKDKDIDKDKDKQRDKDKGKDEEKKIENVAEVKKQRTEKVVLGILNKKKSLNQSLNISNNDIINDTSIFLTGNTSITNIQNTFQTELNEENLLKPIIPLDYTEDEKIASNTRTEEEIRALINLIPKDTKELFVFPIDWKIINKYDVLSERIIPWINKKLNEYLGQEDNNLTLFIIDKLKKKEKNHIIMEELSVVLEKDEAEIFMKLLLRKIIFETLKYK